MVKRSQGFLNRSVGWRQIALCPTIAEHVVWLRSRNPKRNTPIFNTEPSTFDLNPTGGGSIASLHMHCSPTAVFRFVISIVVDSVDRISLRWSATHVCKKVFECLPPFANRNPSASVSMKLMIVGVATPIFHPRPYSPFRGFALPMQIGSGEAVNTDHGSSVLAGHATAAHFGFAKIRCGGDRGVSAVTLALPHGVSCIRDNRTAKYNKSSKSLPLQVQSFRHLIASVFVKQQKHCKVFGIGNQ